MTYNTLRYEVADNILTLTLNRPEHLNSFTVEMANELIEAFNRASDDDEVCVCARERERERERESVCVCVCGGSYDVACTSQLII